MSRLLTASPCARSYAPLVSCINKTSSIKSNQLISTLSPRLIAVYQDTSRFSRPLLPVLGQNCYQERASSFIVWINGHQKDVLCCWLWPILVRSLSIHRCTLCSDLDADRVFYQALEKFKHLRIYANAYVTPVLYSQPVLTRAH